MVYIQRKDTFGLETIDQFEIRKEARLMIKEYKSSDSYASYYLSSRACKAWYNKG